MRSFARRLRLRHLRPEPPSIATKGPHLTGGLAETHPDLPEEFRDLYVACSRYTMTSVERMYGLYEAIRHVVRAGIPGDIVECGVWRGGSSMLAAGTLLRLDELRDIWLYDTFEGMPEPSERDVDHSGRHPADIWEEVKQDRSSNMLAFASRQQAEANLARIGFPREHLHFVRGRVEDTIPVEAPDCIALLRLDTDWFDSTYHELVHLYPRLAGGGVLIVDDYGHWQGAREAVERYFDEIGGGPLLARLDYTGRIAVKLPEVNGGGASRMGGE
jgi:O-methyltransferase